MCDLLCIASGEDPHEKFRQVSCNQKNKQAYILLMQWKFSCFIDETLFSFVAAYENRRKENKVNEIENQKEIEKRKKFVTIQLT